MVKTIILSVIAGAVWIGMHFFFPITWLSMVFPILWAIVISYFYDGLEQKKRRDEGEEEEIARAIIREEVGRAFEKHGEKCPNKPKPDKKPPKFWSKVKYDVVNGNTIKVITSEESMPD